MYKSNLNEKYTFGKEYLSSRLRKLEEKTTGVERLLSKFELVDDSVDNVRINGSG